MRTSRAANVGRVAQMPTKRDVLDVLARATTPSERCRQGWVAPACGAAETAGGAAATWYATWLQRVCDGDSDRAAQILQVRGHDVQQWSQAGGPVRAVPAAIPPDWVGIAVWLLDVASRTDIASLPPAPTLGEVVGPGLPLWVDQTVPWRFFPGFANWLAEADVRLHTTLATCGAPAVAATALVDLRWDLARRMLAVVGPILMSTAEQHPTLFADDPGSDWWALWLEYPMVARLLATCWRQWEAASTELLLRTAADLGELAPKATVTGIDLGAGDRHGDGRAVAALTLDTGERLYYKPKASGPERTLAAVYGALDAHCAPSGSTTAEPVLNLQLPVGYPRDGYCWTREVSRESCTNPEQVSSYFHRAGAALRVLQTLGATDLHHENFVPTASQPVLVDTETAIGPGSGWATAATTPDTTRSFPAFDPMANTPAATSMVTSKVTGPPGRPSLDIGALAGPDTALTPYDVTVLEDSAAGPRLVRRQVAISNGESLPHLAGEPVGVADYLDSVLNGYARAHTAIRDHDIIEGALAESGDAAIRFVARPTQIYIRLLQASLSADALRDGAARELVLERLWRAFGSCPPAVIEAEQTALRELDVPLFTVPLRSTDLNTDRGVVIPAALATAPATEVRHRLAALREADPTGAGSLADLRAALFCAIPTGTSSRASDQTASRARRDSGLAGAPASRADADEVHAGAITTAAAQMLCSLAYPNPGDGHPRWYGLDFDSTRRAWRHRLLGPGLIGEAGIGLALVTAAELLPDVSPQCSQVGVATLLSAASRTGSLRLPWDGADAYTGPAGVLFAVAAAARMQGADSDLTLALPQLVDLVLAAAAHPPASDALDAAAGAVLALAQLPDDTPGSTAALAEAKSLALAHARSATPITADADPSLRSLPSRFAGAIATNPAATDRDSQWTPSPGDQALLAAHGRIPPEEWWRKAMSEATSQQQHADLAWTARACWLATGADLWRQRFTHARLESFRRLGAGVHDVPSVAEPTSNMIFSGQLAPDRRSLSIAHGLAAVVMLGCAKNESTPDVRSFA